MLSKRIIAACAAAFAAVTLLAGCGGNADTAQPSAQETMTKTEAGKYYTEVITPTNDAMDEYTEAESSGDMPSINTAAGKAQTALKKGIEQLKAKAWPVEAQKYVDAVATDLGSEASILGKIKDAATMSEVSNLWSTYQSNGAAASLRKVLGLKSAAMESAAHLGDTQTNGKLQMKLNEVGEKETILSDECSNDCVSGNYAPISPAQGKKYYVASVTITNNSSASIDITCSLPLQVKALNEKGQEFDSIGDLYQIKGNPECNSGLQPGQSANVEYPFEIGQDEKITAISWQDTTYLEQGGNPTALAYFDLTE